MVGGVLVSGDDGPVDVLVTANFRTNNISIIRPGSTGGFMSSAPVYQQIPTGTTPVAVRLGAIDDDNFTDIAVANYGSGTLSIFSGDGTGNFTPSGTLSGLRRPSDILLVDLDGENGINLLVASEYAAGQITVFRQNGNGQFDEGTAYPVGEGPQSLAAGDLDGDGHTDLAVANAESGTVSVLLGDNQSNFVSAKKFGLPPIPGVNATAGQSPQVVLIEDLDGTGNRDLAVAHYLGGISVHLNIVPSDAQTPFRLEPIGDQMVDEEAQLSLTANIVDTDGQADNVTFSLDTAPDNAAIDPVTGEFTWTPTEADGPGTFNVTVTATEGDFSDSRSFMITVNEVNLAPTLDAIEDQNVSSETPFSLTVSATDPDLPANVLTFAAALADGGPLPDWLSINPATRTFSGTPGDADAGTIVVLVTVRDAGGLSDAQTFTITVIAGPFRLAPIDDQTVDEETLVSLTASVIDTDGEADNVTFSLEVAPDGAEIDQVTGEFTWTPSEADGPGVFDVTVTASEGDFSSSQSFTITVNEVNLDPELAAVEDQTVALDTSFFLIVTATDPDLPANVLTLDATLEDGSPLPGWLTFDPATQTFSGTPTGADAGTEVVRVTVTDGAGGSDSQSLSISVMVNRPPELVAAIPDQNANQDVAYNFDISSFFADPDGDTLSFEAITVSGNGDLPSWLNFDPVAGVFSGTPTSEFANTTTSIQVTASDPDGASASDTFDLSVIFVPNMPPSVSEQAFRIDASASDGAIFGTVEATDPNPGDILTYAITAGNENGTFGIDEATGTISVANAAGLQDGSVDILTVEVSDGELMSAAAITIYTTSEPVAVGYILEAYDSAGIRITQVSPGQEFDLRLFVQDRTASPRGAFSAYADITYPAAFVSVSGPIVHSSTYGAGLSGDTNTTGFVDEAGGVDGISDLGGDPIEVLHVMFVVGNDVAVGFVLHFATNPTEDDVQHITTLFSEPGRVVEPERIDFGTLDLTVGPAAVFSASASQATNPLDVNGDLVVSPLDALLIITALNDFDDASSENSRSSNPLPTSNSSPRSLDVNGDGVVSPLDALLVIDALTRPNPVAAPLGARAEIDDSGSSVVSHATTVELRPTSSVRDAIWATLDRQTRLVEEHVRDALADALANRLPREPYRPTIDRPHAASTVTKSIDAWSDLVEEVFDDNLSRWD